MLHLLRPEVEACPCRVCRSDMAYIMPCESPVEVVPVFVIDDPVEQEAPPPTQKARKSPQRRKT